MRTRPIHASNKLPAHPDLVGKVAVVTGGSGGIGAATGRLLAAKVAVNGRDQTKIQAAVDAIHTAGGQAIGVAGDCTDVAAIKRLRQQVEQQFGPAEAWPPSPAAGGHDPGRRRARRSGTWTACGGSTRPGRARPRHESSTSLPSSSRVPGGQLGSPDQDPPGRPGSTGGTPRS